MQKGESTVTVPLHDPVKKTTLKSILNHRGFLRGIIRTSLNFISDNAPEFKHRKEANQQEYKIHEHPPRCLPFLKGGR